MLEDILLKEAEKLCLNNNFLNKVVYDHEETSPYHSKVDAEEAKKYDIPYYIPENEQDVTLIFESRFESGNLKKVIQIAPFEYNLIINADYGTGRHT